MAGWNFCSGFGVDGMALVHVSAGFKIILLSKPPHQIPTWDLEEEGARQLRLIFVVVVVSGRGRPVMQHLQISFLLAFYTCLPSVCSFR